MRMVLRAEAVFCVVGGLATSEIAVNAAMSPTTVLMAKFRPSVLSLVAVTKLIDVKVVSLLFSSGSFTKRPLEVLEVV